MVGFTVYFIYNLYMEKINNITPFNQDIAKWYSDLVLQSDLISYAPVKGTMFFKPHGFAIWNNISKLLNEEFVKKGVEQVQFPLLFPEALLKKEADHVEGFAPEVLTVTRVGEKDLNEPLVIRPTSEILFGTFFNETLNSYSQLPMKLNQWCNVMRWENNTRPFLRNSEFFWQEGHTVHATTDDAHNFAKEMHQVYHEFANDILLLPTIKGEKSVIERFAGADNTYTIETILKDGQALQSGTSHYLGDSFAKAFDVRVQGPDNKMYNPYQTSWGVSTRLIGAIIMTHSDDRGLVLPSKIAPVQVAVLTLFADKEPKVIEVANELAARLNFRVKVDSSNKGIGFKAQEWELKGAPIRIEIGPRDLENGKVTLSVRNGEQKVQYDINDINDDLIDNLVSEHDSKMYKLAENIRDEKRVEFTNVDEINSIVESGNYGVAYWTENEELEKKIKEETGATIRCLIDDVEGECIHSGSKVSRKAIFARAY